MADLNELSEKLSQIRQEITAELGNLENSKSVYEYRKTIMDSKTGKIGSLMKEMGKIPNEMKADYGKMVNEIKGWAQSRFEEIDTKLKEKEMELRLVSCIGNLVIGTRLLHHNMAILHPITKNTHIALIELALPYIRLIAGKRNCIRLCRLLARCLYFLRSNLVNSFIDLRERHHCRSIARSY